MNTTQHIGFFYRVSRRCDRLNKQAKAVGEAFFYSSSLSIYLYTRVRTTRTSETSHYNGNTVASPSSPFQHKHSIIISSCIDDPNIINAVVASAVFTTEYTLCCFIIYVVFYEISIFVVVVKILLLLL